MTAAATGRTTPIVKQLEWPSDGEILAIKNGTQTLTALIPKFKINFDDYINSKAYDIPEFGEGITRLQEAINNKTAYRKEKTMMPSWIYMILDFLGIGSVGKAQRELHRQINVVLNLALAKNDVSDISMYFEKIDVAYQKKHFSHELFTKNKEIEAIQKIVKAASIAKNTEDKTIPDFYVLLLKCPQDPKAKEELKAKLVDFLKQDPKGDKKLFAKLQYSIVDKGPTYNLLQLMIWHKQYDLLLQLVHEKDGILNDTHLTKEVLIQPFKHLEIRANDLIELLAVRNEWQIQKSPYSGSISHVILGDSLDKKEGHVFCHLLSRVNKIICPKEYYSHQKNLNDERKKLLCQMFQNAKQRH